MGKLDIKQSTEVNASASKAWEIIGPNFVNISDWGRGISKSWKNDSAQQNFADAPAGGRYCDVSGFGKFDERIIHFDSGNHEISWSATGEKLPGFVSDLQNALSVQTIDENSCRITSNITANLGGIQGFFLGPIMKKNFSVFRGSEDGFTLLELLIVMLIIGLLAAFVAPRMIGKVGKSKQTIAKAQIESLCTAIETYKLDTDKYPSQEEGLTALVTTPGDADNWGGPYLAKRKE